MYRYVIAALIGTVALAAPARAADPQYMTIKMEIDVAKPAAAVWAKVGGYCDITKWLPQLKTCALTTGDGHLGSVRRLADRIDELMVAEGKYYYVYAQPAPPGRDIMYHGTLEAVADGKNKTTLVYNLVWDQAPLADDKAKQDDRDRRTKSFTDALANMKKLAEEK